MYNAIPDGERMILSSGLIIPAHQSKTYEYKIKSPQPQQGEIMTHEILLLIGIISLVCIAVAICTLTWEIFR